jgi:Zn-dependent peptidase ImmA (M78 family)
VPEKSAFLRASPAIRRIEERAAQCVRVCCRKLGLNEVPLPIPVDEWIEGPLDIRFGITDLSYLGEDVLGAAFVKEREILVSDSVLVHEPRYRFTCAHELGHLTLHARTRRVFHETETATFSSLQPYERQADRFAAALLMPVPLLVRQLLRICEDHRLKSRECIIELMLDTAEAQWLWKKKFLPELTRRFGVSLSATLHRFRDIRLHDGKPFLLPDHMERLLTPAGPESPVASIGLVDGFPRRKEEKV